MTTFRFGTGIFIYYVLLVFIFHCAPVTGTDSDFVVQTESGLLRGVRTADGVRMFLGIPYAKPPIGPLRWKPPQPADAWSGVRNATAFGHVCHDFPGGIVSSDPAELSEDCLVLNVWLPPPKPQQTRDTKLPVAVFLHGKGMHMAPLGDAILRAQSVLAITPVHPLLWCASGQLLFRWWLHHGLCTSSTHISIADSFREA